MPKQSENERDRRAADEEATGIPNRTGSGTDPEPTPPRGQPKEDRQPGPHGRRPNGDHAP
jgi:hypothetical protein